METAILARFEIISADCSTHEQTRISLQKIKLSVWSAKENIFFCGFDNMDPRLFNPFSLDSLS